MTSKTEIVRLNRRGTDFFPKARVEVESPLVINIFYRVFRFISRAVGPTDPPKPACWCRYVDDIFVVRSHDEEEIQNFQKHLNSIHPNDRFTIETEICHTSMCRWRGSSIVDWDIQFTENPHTHKICYSSRHNPSQKHLSDGPRPVIEKVWTERASIWRRVRGRVAFVPRTCGS
jgi:hypothetical protein